MQRWVSQRAQKVVYQVYEPSEVCCLETLQWQQVFFQDSRQNGTVTFPGDMTPHSTVFEHLVLSWWCLGKFRRCGLARESSSVLHYSLCVLCLCRARCNKPSAFNPSCHLLCGYEVLFLRNGKLKYTLYSVCCLGSWCFIWTIEIWLHFQILENWVSARI